MANTLSGSKLQPVITKSPPTTVADMNALADYAARVGNTISDTAAARGSFSAAWEGLVWNETDTGLSYRRVSGSWVPVGPFTARAVRRDFANNNSYTTGLGVPTQLPNATDKAGADMSFVKRYGSTRLIIHLESTLVCNSLPAEQSAFALLNINGTNYRVATRWMNNTSTRYDLSGTAEVTGIPLGTYTIGPRFQSGGSAAFDFTANRDFVAFSVIEAI